MNILINLQTFENELLYNEISLLSENKKYKTIFLSSSLMHDLDDQTKSRYNSIHKVQIIESNTLFTNNTFKQSKFNLTNTFIEKEEFLYTDILSSFRWMPISMRKENDVLSFAMVFYYDIYNFWNAFFKNNKISSIIQLNEEHSSLDSILIRVAKEYHIKNIITSRIVGAYTQQSEEYHAFYDNNKNKYLNLSIYKSTYDTSSPLDIDSNYTKFSADYKTTLFNKFQYYLMRLIKLKNQKLPFTQKLSTVFKAFINLVSTRILLSYQYYYLKSLKKFYDSNSKNNINLKKKYIYYCLHFDPEAATLPKDNAYSNQLLNLRILSSSIPNDWVIYVKEHPHQLDYRLYKEYFLNQLHSIDNFRSKAFYKYIKTLDQVELIGFGNNHQDLISNAQFIASNSGTIFREANYLYKKCLTFSKNSFHRLLNNVYFIDDSDTCKNILENHTHTVINKSDANNIFDDYTITLKNLDRRSSDILKFLIDNKLLDGMSTNL